MHKPIGICSGFSGWKEMQQGRCICQSLCTQEHHEAFKAKSWPTSWCWSSCEVARTAATWPASAAGVGWSKAAVTERLMPNLAMMAFLSSTAPSESSPACARNYTIDRCIESSTIDMLLYICACPARAAGIRWPKAIMTPHRIAVCMKRILDPGAP